MAVGGLLLVLGLKQDGVADGLDDLMSIITIRLIRN